MDSWADAAVPCETTEIRKRLQHLEKIFSCQTGLVGHDCQPLPTISCIIFYLSRISDLNINSYWLIHYFHIVLWFVQYIHGRPRPKRIPVTLIDGFQLELTVIKKITKINLFEFVFLTLSNITKKYKFVKKKTIRLKKKFNFICFSCVWVFITIGKAIKLRSCVVKIRAVFVVDLIFGCLNSLNHSTLLINWNQSN